MNIPNPERFYSQKSPKMHLKGYLSVVHGRKWAERGETPRWNVRKTRPVQGMVKNMRK